MSTNRPPNCRDALQAAGKPYPKSGCAVCETGGITGCPYDRAESSNAGDTRMKLTADDMVLEMVRLWGEGAATYTQQAAGLLPFIERHIAGQQGEGVGVELLERLLAEIDKISDCTDLDPEDWDGINAAAKTVRTALATRSPQPAICETCNDHGAVGSGQNSEPCPACATDQPAKPAGAVTMPVMEILDRREVTPLCDHVVMGYTEAQMVAYGNAREARQSEECISLSEQVQYLDIKLAEMEAREAAAGGVPAGLEYVMTLVEAAAPGPWLWSENGNIVPEQYTDDCEIAAVYSERDDDGCPINASAIIGAVNWLRANGRNMLAAAIPQQPTAELAVEATGTVDSTTLYTSGECLVEIMLDSILPPHWMDGDNVRVTISPTGGKSDA